ncbi:hypothetical protein PCE1_004239 [Barthelona sp. PCE]
MSYSQASVEIYSSASDASISSFENEAATPENVPASVILLTTPPPGTPGIHGSSLHFSVPITESMSASPQMNEELVLGFWDGERTTERIAVVTVLFILAVTIVSVVYGLTGGFPWIMYPIGVFLILYLVFWTYEREKKREPRILWVNIIVFVIINVLLIMTYVVTRVESTVPWYLLPLCIWFLVLVFFFSPWAVQRRDKGEIFTISEGEATFFEDEPVFEKPRIETPAVKPPALTSSTFRRMYTPPPTPTADASESTLVIDQLIAASTPHIHERIAVTPSLSFENEEFSVYSPSEASTIGMNDAIEIHDFIEIEVEEEVLIFEELIPTPTDSPVSLFGGPSRAGLPPTSRSRSHSINFN